MGVQPFIPIDGRVFPGIVYFTCDYIYFRYMDAPVAPALNRFLASDTTYLAV